MPRSGDAVDPEARPDWQRTGYLFFPYAAQQSGQWWVLRWNTHFPAHDMFTLFVDGHAVADATGDPNSPLPLLMSLAALSPTSSDEATLDPDTARAVVSAVAAFADYGSEEGDPCIFCDDDRDGLTREE